MVMASGHDMIISIMVNNNLFAIVRIHTSGTEILIIIWGVYLLKNTFVVLYERYMSMLL